MSAPVTRFYALDRMRALAVVSMVQGHTFSALMAEDALPRSVMQVHALVHGLTAPAFLFGAGLAFGLATYPSYARHHAGGEVLWARLRRYVWLLLLGYALQLPGSSLLAALRMRTEELTPVFRVGPLHLIAFCLVVCQLAALVSRSARQHALFAFVLGLAITLAAPQVYTADAARAAGPVFGAWLDASSGSLFPIFPWAGFVFFGVALGGLLDAYCWRTDPLSSVRKLALPSSAVWLGIGLLFAGSAYLLFRVGVRLSDPKWFWHASPLNVLFRGGLVLCLLGLLQRLPTPSPEAQRCSATSLLARHSLVAYVVHLLLLYGTPYTPSLNKHFGLRFDAWQVTLTFAAIMSLTMLAIRLWVSMTEQRYPQAGWLRAALTMVSLLVLMR